MSLLRKWFNFQVSRCRFYIWSILSIHAKFYLSKFSYTLKNTLNYKIEGCHLLYFNSSISYLRSQQFVVNKPGQFLKHSAKKGAYSGFANWWVNVQKGIKLLIRLMQILKRMSIALSFVKNIYFRNTGHYYNTLFITLLLNYVQVSISNVRQLSFKNIMNNKIKQNI